ncbi:hypothetical protein [uncultured Mucilaginibacter sp.]|uniref:hypothetical protein n=1 Tax=uncultured Mucilaginibacter sp. TaxID=797541 RepID=UPI0025F70591|nr:hypothetical protein [uncultured Mucilaginibacter sp.]
MTKKVLIISGLVLLIGLTLFYFIFIYGRMSFRWNRDTPEKYLSHVVASKKIYAKDRAEISKKFRHQVNNHTDFFESHIYDDDTQIIIDTILYSPDFNKIAILFLTKDLSTKLPDPNFSSNWFYAGSCYLGTRQKDTLSLSWIGPSYDNSPSKTRIINLIHEYYFRLRATEKDENGRYPFNLNDTRFWTSPIWKEQEDKKQREKDFQELKRKHPEDVYEPPR